MASGSNSLIWSGEQVFLLIGADGRVDSLHIKTTAPKSNETPLRLILPTLCITYADMAFSNAIGGRQEDYPASQGYGPRYFDPPVEFNGAAEVEKFTWIRGAHRVQIGPRETEIDWNPQATLIIPHLRLDGKTPATASLLIKGATIPVDQPLVIRVMQYADGRHIGGIRVEKRHPDWKPPEAPDDYDLWVRLVDAATGAPVPEAMLNFFRLNPAKATPSDLGGFDLNETRFTDRDGVINDPRRPAGVQEAVSVHLPGWRAVARCFRPLAGQHMRLFIRLWPLRPDTAPYTWRQGDRLEEIASLTGHPPGRILTVNGLADASQLKPGAEIRLPCYNADYHMEPGDTYEWLAGSFGYSSAQELARDNGVNDLAEMAGDRGVSLPGWRFFYARRDEWLPGLDEMFRLPAGSARTVGRVHHADPRLPYAGETIALPIAARRKSRARGG